MWFQLLVHTFDVGPQVGLTGEPAFAKVTLCHLLLLHTWGLFGLIDVVQLPFPSLALASFGAAVSHVSRRAQSD